MLQPVIDPAPGLLLKAVQPIGYDLLLFHLTMSAVMRNCLTLKLTRQYTRPLKIKPLAIPHAAHDTSEGSILPVEMGAG
jgi:hypothetical protein